MDLAVSETILQLSSRDFQLDLLKPTSVSQNL